MLAPNAQEVEEGAREAEEDLRGLVRQRESEIESLTRRRDCLRRLYVYTRALAKKIHDTIVKILEIINAMKNQ